MGLKVEDTWAWNLGRPIIVQGYVRACLAPLLLVASPAFAQSANVAMSDALAQLALNPRFTLQTVAFEDTKGRPARSFVSFAVDNRPDQGTFRFEVNVHEDGKIARRLVGDGTWLWDYGFKANAYSSLAYGSPEGGLDPKWRQKLFSRLKLLLDGPSLFTARIVADSIGAQPGSTWTPWFPTATLTVDSGGVLASAQSPYAARTRYEIAGGLTRVVHDGVPSPDTSERFVTTVYSGQFPPDVDFAFVPPKGSRAIAASERQGR